MLCKREEVGIERILPDCWMNRYVVTRLGRAEFDSIIRVPCTYLSSVEGKYSSSSTFNIHMQQSKQENVSLKHALLNFKT